MSPLSKCWNKIGINVDLKLFMSKLREIIVLVWKALPCFETMFSQVSYLEFSLGTDCLLKILETLIIICVRIFLPMAQIS